MTGLKRTLRSRRGFTLVELVVVLVIAGITASFAVPALTGYIDNAKEKQAVSETQACVETATRIAAQKYAEWQRNTTYQLAGGNELTSSAEFQPLVGCTGTTSNTPPAVTGGDVALTEGSGQYLLHVSDYGPGGFPKTGSTADISAAASVTGTIQTLTCSSSGQVVYLVYTSKDGITVVYTNNGRSSTVSTKADAVVVPTPGPDSSGGGGETGGGGTTGGGETGGGGTTGGGETGSTATAGEKQFIIHMQDVSTGNYAPFANKRYHIKSGENSFDVTSDKNGDILLKISRQNDHLRDTVIGDTKTTITEYKVPDGYQVIPSSTEIYINVRNNGNDYFLNSMQDGVNNNPFVVDMPNRRLTLMRFPVAKLKLRVTDREEKPLPGAIFEIMCDSKPVATLTCNAKGECSIPVKLHDGDNIGESFYLTAESQLSHTYVIKETYPPAGYQGDITCSFHLYYQPYPSEPTPHHETWFYIDSNNGDHGEWGSYEREKTVDKVDREDSFHVINTERKLCTVYIRKIDDAGNAVSDANLKLTADNNRDAIVNTNVMEGFVSSKQFSTAAAVFEVRQGQSYTLEEINAPAGYTKADKLTFSVEPGCTKKEVTMIDHNSSEDKSDIKLDKVTFNQANNWAHKLTTDGKISFSGGEIICWKGIAYYNYAKNSDYTYNISNNKRDDYKKVDSPELNNAPDPMTFLSNYLYEKKSDKKAADYIVSLTGKAYRYNEENVTLKKGDIVIPADYGDGIPEDNKNKKVYVYIGETDLSLTDKTLSDKKENFTTLEHKLQDNNIYNFTLNK
ncbi:MAG: type II secretion system protein [Gemmiger sp.]|uniref:MSCRAMM family protein n=1 Tax=Gemmiger sp. TaxID=2049027 RepID=UPI002E786796|nr:type II secretion system protein [Gemmiger sp.]MEE0498071.1 type II secretion system protein [Gemmiger sp.]